MASLPGCHCHAASLDGHAVVVDALRRVVGALKGHGQRGVGLPRPGQRARSRSCRPGSGRQAQGLHGGIVVIDDVLIGAVAADQNWPYWPLITTTPEDRCLDAGAGPTETTCRWSALVAMSTSVSLVSTLPLGSTPTCSVVGAAGFDGGGTVIDRTGGVVDRGKDDLQGIGVG